MQIDVHETLSRFYTPKKILHESTRSIRIYVEIFFKWSCMLRSINYLPAQTTALNQLIKRIPWNAGSGASSPCLFARNDMFSSLFAVLELSGRCAAWFKLK